ncbi:MAG: hypothetical protein IH948_08675, partial [Bacteroidetes bacterium]|nr:hypothetical protein [Bacteroidota bacterium]
NERLTLKVDTKTIPKDVIASAKIPETAMSDNQKIAKLNMGDMPPKILFEEHFNYNMKDLKNSSKDFTYMMDKIASKIIESGKQARLRIEASASSVPTRKYKSNEELAKIRKESGKINIVVALQSAGLTQDDVNFVEEKSFVSGPKYNNDAFSNKDMYKKYQYIKVYLYD